MKLEEFESYLDDRFENRKTSKQYFSIVRNFTQLKTRDDDLLVQAINRYITEQPSSSTRLYAMRHWLQFIGKGHLTYKLRKPPETARKDLTKSIPFGFIKKLISNTEDPETQLIFRCLYDCAARIGGILSLEKRNIEQDDDGMVKILFVEKRKKPKTAYLSTPTGKQLLEFVRNIKGHSRVFNKEYKEVYKELAQLSEKELGFRISTHWFRHSRAMHLFEKGYDIFTVQRQLRHESIDATMHYLQASGIESKKLMKLEEPKW